MRTFLFSVVILFFAVDRSCAFGALEIRITLFGDSCFSFGPEKTIPQTLSRKKWGEHKGWLTCDFLSMS